MAEGKEDINNEDVKYFHDYLSKMSDSNENNIDEMALTMAQFCHEMDEEEQQAEKDLMDEKVEEEEEDDDQNGQEVASNPSDRTPVPSMEPKPCTSQQSKFSHCTDRTSNTSMASHFSFLIPSSNTSSAGSDLELPPFPEKKIRKVTSELSADSSATSTNLDN